MLGFCIEGLSEEQVFTGDNLIISTVLDDLELTVEREAHHQGDRVLQGR
jgi:hypothetical protein